MPKGKPKGKKPKLDKETEQLLKDVRAALQDAGWSASGIDYTLACIAICTAACIARGIPPKVCAANCTARCLLAGAAGGDVPPEAAGGLSGGEETTPTASCEASHCRIRRWRFDPQTLRLDAVVLPDGTRITVASGLMDAGVQARAQAALQRFIQQHDVPVVPCPRGCECNVIQGQPENYTTPKERVVRVEFSGGAGIVLEAEGRVVGASCELEGLCEPTVLEGPHTLRPEHERALDAITRVLERIRRRDPTFGCPPDELRRCVEECLRAGGSPRDCILRCVADCVRKHLPPGLEPPPGWPPGWPWPRPSHAGGCCCGGGD